MWKAVDYFEAFEERVQFRGKVSRTRVSDLSCSHVHGWILPRGWECYPRRAVVVSLLNNIAHNLLNLSVALRSLVRAAGAGICNIFILESLDQHLRLEKIQREDLTEQSILRSLEFSSLRE